MLNRPPTHVCVLLEEDNGEKFLVDVGNGFPGLPKVSLNFSECSPVYETSYKMKARFRFEENFYYREHLNAPWQQENDDFREFFHFSLETFKIEDFRENLERYVYCPPKISDVSLLNHTLVASQMRDGLAVLFKG